MHWPIPVLVLGLVIVAFFGVVYAGVRSWPKMGNGKRVGGLLLLVPHFLLIVCIVVGVLCGQAPQGSQAWNTAFFCDVLMVFILPVPALAGTIAALIIFQRARAG